MTALKLPAPPEGARPSRSSRGARLQSLTLELKTVTPILGGGPVTRRLPEVDIIRVPTLRGHLRFWWRALYGHAFTAEGEPGRQELARRERELWGGMGQGGEGARRSQVELRVFGIDNAQGDPLNVELGDPRSYALWPARKTQTQDVAPRWKPGLRFCLELLAPEGDAFQQACQALRAWLLFGGYGSRTRRGCGSVVLVSPEKCREWLPGSAARDELRRLFVGVPLLESGQAGPPCDLPLLRGARLYRSGVSESNPDGAWQKALGWLREFRQGTSVSGQRSRESLPARNPGEGKRAGRSNWPEADKIRHHARARGGPARGPAFPSEHAPRPQHTREPAWPRAGFGLPIVFHFQQEVRKKKPDAPRQNYTPAEPEGVELQWEDASRERHDRLASPLIVKALPLADGRFEPIALWFERGYPEDGGVVMVQGGRTVPGTRADFDVLSAREDAPLFWPLRRERGLRDAFFGWLKDTGKAREA
ncbi:type III-B CRISPR module RAMP protein Cmr1 [Myxococcus sp. RHSTA-1-4]|uniref:type III-B CRISPR module RAMP protein Cmr1 n=1 Tax=Myxococcus sp. RHSTA-1-4 TaxID=2874601 RepID=UPI001CBD946D|nr:type III-B CRISPR module RAMP protein Cmr1 [Myxococcus sp. RHSTA-1-4]MBZ4423276.1 type III-B CRISPR module RAMP protein Cmr1 [Myxococcus sp. RHSTA-1-4]